MNLDKIPAGKNLPNDVYVIIEIPLNSSLVKYEIDRKSGIMFVDRFISVNMFYPCNYGFVNSTLSLDGDAIDALVLTHYPLITGSVISCRPIGLLNMIDDSGNDSKLITVPNESISKDYNHILDIKDLSESTKSRISHFFKHYKDLEKNKWTNIIGWSNAESAKEEIITSLKRLQLYTKSKTKQT